MELIKWLIIVIIIIEVEIYKVKKTLYIVKTMQLYNKL